MKVIDLTHVIVSGMPVYPGTEGPQLEPANSYERDGFRETRLTMYSHTGTHMDAPAHLFPNGITLDRFPTAQFVGPALVVDCSHLQAGEAIGMEQIRRLGALAERAEFLLFQTGWSRYWGTGEYFGDYPCITFEVVDYLLSTGKKGVGLDTIGLDPIAAAELPRHRRLLQSDSMVILENLTNLEKIGSERFLLCALPLKQAEGDGAPVRAVAILPEGT